MGENVGLLDEIAIVVAHSERATVRVGDMFLKIDADPERLRAEAEVMATAPVPTPTVLWKQRSVLALAAVPGRPLGRLGDPVSSSSAAWAAAGAAIRTLHDAPLPARIGASADEIAAELDDECRWLMDNDVLPGTLISRNRSVAAAALRSWTPKFMHGDLQISHVFVDENDRVTGILDWSEAAQGDALYDLATLTLGHQEHLEDLIAGYGADVDGDVIRAWWSVRSLLGARWLIQHGFDPDSPGCEFDVLRAQRQ